MTRIKGRELRHNRIRKRIFGTARIPRMVVYRSLKNIYAQLVDDLSRRTLLSASTNIPALKEKLKYGGNVKAAAELGEYLAKRAADKGITNIVFDRCGYKYHGRVKALVESAREAGLSFGNSKKES